MQIFGLSDIGQQRSENQDAFRFEVIEPGIAVFVVCDGMGGARGGNVASTIASEVFLEHMKRDIRPHISEKYARSILLNAINFANYEVYKKSVSEADYKGMGTTLIGGFCQDDSGFLANIGDSRAYYLSADAISRITRDHSVVEDLIVHGHLTEEQARKHPRRNLITRALGTDEKVEADYYPFRLSGSDMLLLCTDGLTGPVEDAALHALYKDHTTPESCAHALIDAANAAGGPDNITALLLCVQEGGI